MDDVKKVPTVPYICLFDQLDRAFSTMQVESMKSVEQEDNELNSDFSVDPLADPRLDKMDLFNLTDGDTRDAIMNSNSSFASADGDVLPMVESTDEATSASGSGE